MHPMLASSHHHRRVKRTMMIVWTTLLLNYVNNEVLNTPLVYKHEHPLQVAGEAVRDYDTVVRKWIPI
jgi:hypothetical protein